MFCSRRQIPLCIVMSLLLFLAGSPAQVPLSPFAAGGSYDPAVPTPDAVLGFPAGTRPARYDEVVRYLDAVAGKSPKVKVREFGKSHEGRPLISVVVSSAENIARLDQLQANNLQLASPGRLSSGQVETLIASSPVFVWAEYAIHGDELSSVDAALQIIYHLAAGTDTATAAMLRGTVIAIDPVVNPDGRERFLAQMQQWNGEIPNPDPQSLHHTGTWPWGRGNHYLFDLNRDWFFLVHPEMQQRVRALVRWMPQLVIDSHEMGGNDTYLFSPPREPLNPNISPVAHRWWGVFARDQAAAFDRFGWSYYTREWNDDWYPGYGASWPLYLDAVGILYEQAGVEGTLVKRSDGSILTYRDAVHHHVTSSLANFATAARHRSELLADFVAARRAGVSAGSRRPGSFYILPGNNPTRAARLVERLLWSGIEVERIDQPSAVSGLVDCRGRPVERKSLPAGTYVVSLSQPNGRLAKTLLEFDPHMKTAVLAEERKSLEKEKSSKMYDVTAWSLLLAYGLEGYWSAAESPRPRASIAAPAAPGGSLEDPEAGYGFVMSCSDDREVELLCAMLPKGFRARSAKEPFSVGGHSYARGSILFRRNENPPGLAEALKSAAVAGGVVVRGVRTALASSGSDLGGNDMVLLREPRVALVAGPEISSTSFGWAWHFLEKDLGLRITLLAAHLLGNADLEKYNILLIPSADPGSLSRVLGKGGIAKLKSWVEGGGTLIAESDAAAWVADTSTGLSQVRLRQQALKDLALYAAAAEIERKASDRSIDSAAVWGNRAVVRDSAKDGGPAGSVDEKALALQDERARLFSPQGAILSVDCDPEHWLTYGIDTAVPVMADRPLAFLSKGPVQTPGRFSEAPLLRIAGLLWPEARDRIARTAYATREPKGQGQIILFAGDPAFRGGFRGSERLLVNAVLLGPGNGTAPKIDW